jgi:hypothetical protein
MSTVAALALKHRLHKFDYHRRVRRRVRVEYDRVLFAHVYLWMYGREGTVDQLDKKDRDTTETVTVLQSRFFFWALLGIIYDLTDMAAAGNAG